MIETNNLQHIFEAQTAYQWQARKTTAEQRKAKLLQLKDAILAKLDAFTEAASKDFFMPPATAANQVHAVLGALDYTVAHLEQWMQPEYVEQPVNDEAYILYEARGRVCVFGTWNSPMSVIIHPLIEAYAAGNCVVLKPSEFNPHYNDVLAQVIADVFHEQEVALVQGEADVSQQLLQLPFDHFFFTGSPRVGKIIMKEAANHLAMVTLELGGKSPVVIDRQYDALKAAQSLVFSKVLMGGQFCISPDYLFVHESGIDAFTQAFNMMTQGILYDENGLKKHEMTQIVNDMHYKRLKHLLDDALSKGATVLSGGFTDDEARLIEPTLLGGVTEDMAIHEEEIFGPLTYVKLYNDVDEALQFIQQRPKPLALYMYSDDEAFQQRVLQASSSGGVTINSVFLHNVHLPLPFGGVNNSGLGSFHGIHGFKTFSHARAVYKAN